MNSIEASKIDPFIYDIERLQEVASDKIIKRGIAYHKENRVMDLTFDGEVVHSKVEGSDPREPYFVSISFDSDGELLVDCGCPFSWEPVCKHGVATLLAYESENNIKEDELQSASHEAASERAKRGRTQVQVEHISGEPWFGMWRACSITSHFATRGYDVQIRSLDERKNYCTCADFATNLLGTCKHIEAVLHTVKKKFSKRVTPACSFVYLAWNVPDAPKIQVHRSTRLEQEVREVIDHYFDHDGTFKGSPLQDFFSFQEQCDAFENLIIGRDAVDYVRLLSSEAEHQVESKIIQNHIVRSGGHLKGIRTKLYSYQIEGVAFLASSRRVLLADDMGLGKTIQAISASHWLMERGKALHALVVCPASLKTQWAREIEKFTGRSVQVIQGGAKVRTMQYRRKADFTIVNYELVLRDVFDINKNLAQDLLILDEAQRVKNWRTKTAAAVKLLHNQSVFVLTGTPLENRLEDLFSLVQIVDQRVLGPLWQFLIKYHIRDERGKVLGYRNLTELRGKLSTVMLRRDRSLVKDQLPDRIETRLDVEMDLDQRRYHVSAMSSVFKFREIAKKRPLTPGETHMLMASLQQARMACDAAGLVDKETVGSPKLSELTILLEELCVESDRKVVVFSEWRNMTDMVQGVVESLGLGFVHLHGGIPTKKRGPLMDAFREDSEVRVFISTDAGGVGLNLQSGNVLINIDMPWNPAILNQRIARIHRLGQKESVQVILMIAKNSYEERVAGLVNMKMELFENVVMDEADKDVVGISKKMLESILESLDEVDDNHEKGASAAEEEEPLELTPEESIESEREEEKGLTEEDHQIRAAIEQLQALLGSKLEMVLGTGTSLLAVLDSVNEEVDKQVQNIQDVIPIACIDTRTYHVLKKLGKGSPLSEAKTVFSRDKHPQEVSPYLAIAKRKLKAAEVLFGESMTAESMELIAHSMLATLAARNNLDELPSLENASVWIYTEALSKNMVTPEEANTMTKVIALTQAPAIPVSLCQDLLREANLLVHSL